MDTTDKRTGAQKAQLAADTREQITQILQGHLMPLNAQVIHDLFDKIVAPLQQENDRLKEEVKLFAGGLEEQDARVTKFEAENDRLRLALSGKTGYDQVEVAMNKLTAIMGPGRFYVLADWLDVKFPDDGTEVQDDLRKFGNTLTSLLSSPVSGEGKPTEI